MTVYTIEPVTVPAGDTVGMQYEFINDNGTIPDLSELTGLEQIASLMLLDKEAISLQLPNTEMCFE